ncbi:hypothetical protein [Streptomyces sp. TN58]|uniref:hypothetical protein n=1 Tax=Streptomyces sp. TN58 TaxID=234612 RepID=UPI0009509FC6|nr:hypothetical protein [Streptomyces sp. TN58]APU43407.1 hypothetical protein BSL84_30265 [Streptomyces sp. TN58]
MNQDTDLLAGSPFAGDLDADLKAAPARRRLPGVALFLAAGVVAVGGFIGGVYVEKGTGDTSGARPSGGQMPGGDAAAGNRPQGRLPGATGEGGGGGGQGRQGMSSGTISKIKDGVVEVTTPDGKTVEVKTGDSVMLRPQTQSPAPTQGAQQ